MQIVFVYDSSVAGAPSGFTSALQAAAQYLDDLITDAILVTIQVGWGENNGAPIIGGIATGGPAHGIGETYAQVKSQLAAHATSVADATVLANLPASDPTGGGTFYVAAAQQKAWGLLSPTSSEIDGTIGFGSGTAFNFDPLNRAVAGETDFVGVAEHELTHALGRMAGLQYAPGWYLPLDLLRFASPGRRQFVGGQPAYFSIDGGLTNLNPFDTRSDYGDWDSSVQGDSFGYAYTGTVNAVTAVDMMEMDGLGFDIAGAGSAPAMSSISATPSNATLGTGADVQLLLHFTTTVTVSGGVPTLALTDGGVAVYTGGSGTADLAFSTSVGAGQRAIDLALVPIGAVQLNGAIIAGAPGSADAGIAAVLGGADGANPSGVLRITGLAQRADFNGDGTSDILWHNTVDGSVVTWMMNAGHGISAALLLADPAWMFVGSGDFDGDGAADLLWSSAVTGAVVGWQMNAGKPSAAATLLSDPGWMIAGTGDFGGDGKSDILWRNAVTGNVVEWQMNGFVPITTTTLLSDPAWNVAGTGDFNGDGVADVLWRNATTGTVVEWQMSNGAPTAAIALLQDPAWTVAGAADFTGDGVSDILWHNAATGSVVEWTMNAGTPTGAAGLLDDPSWAVAGTGDYNDDGTADIIWYNATTGSTVAWQMTAGAPPVATTLLGGTAWSPVAALLASG